MNDRLIGLVPAAGKGMRLNLPYPKELYPIIRDNRYKPLAQFVVENLIASGAKHIVFVINETKHQLVGYFGSGKRFGCRFSYVVQDYDNNQSESTSPGLANALDSAYHLIKEKTVLFGMADTIMQPQNVFSNLLGAAQSQDQVILGLFKVDRPEKFGMVEYDSNWRVKQIIDKPKKTDLKYAWGCIAWRPQFSEFMHSCINEENISDFALIMNNAIRQGLSFRSFIPPGGSYADLGTYVEILDMERKNRAK